MTNTPSIARPRIAIFASLLLATTGAVQAQTETRVVGLQTRVQMVPYDRSELSSQDGVRGLQSRVRHAAHEVCASGPREFAIGANTREHRCFSRSIKDGFAQIDRAVASSRNNSEMAMAENILVTER